MCDLHSVVAPKATWSITVIGRATAFLVPHTELRAVAMRYPAIALASGPPRRLSTGINRGFEFRNRALRCPLRFDRFETF